MGIIQKFLSLFKKKKAKIVTGVDFAVEEKFKWFNEIMPHPIPRNARHGLNGLVAKNRLEKGRL